MSISLKDVEIAADRLRGNVEVTPFLRSQTLSHIMGAEVFLKFENLQFTASFKERGALNKLLSLSTAERRQGVIASSAGNHAQGLAYHAKRLGIHAVIVMPSHTPDVKIEHTRAQGAEVILHGETFDDAQNFARDLEKKRKLVFVHPFDDPLVMAGQGTVAMEMLEQEPGIQTIIVPVGGGGLAAGVATAAKGINSQIDIVGVQSERFPAMWQRLRRQPVECAQYTVAEGIAVKNPGTLTQPIIAKLVRDILLVGEGDLEDAILLLLQVEKTVVEGAGAAGLAALLKNKKMFRHRKVGLVLCGGNIDLMVLSSIIQRGLARSGRLVRLRVETRDVPGELARVTGIIGQASGNIVELHHQRAFSTRPLQTALVEFVLQTRGSEHRMEVVKALQDAGYHVSIPDETRA